MVNFGNLTSWCEPMVKPCKRTSRTCSLTPQIEQSGGRVHLQIDPYIPPMPTHAHRARGASQHVPGRPREALLVPSPRSSSDMTRISIVCRRSHNKWCSAAKPHQRMICGNSLSMTQGRVLKLGCVSKPCGAGSGSSTGTGCRVECMMGASTDSL